MLSNSEKKGEEGCEKWMWDFSLIKMLNRKGFGKFRLKWKFQRGYENSFCHRQLFSYGYVSWKRLCWWDFENICERFFGHHHKWKTLLNDMLISASFWHGQLKSIKKPKSPPLFSSHTFYSSDKQHHIHRVVWGEKKDKLNKNLCRHITMGCHFSREEKNC